MKKLVPLLIALAGILGGAGAGFVLRPAPEAESMAAADGYAAATEDNGQAVPDDPGAEPPDADAAAPGDDDADEGGVPDYVKLSNQFVVPVVEEGRVAAMVILSLTLEVPVGGSEAIYAREPKLRDAFLQVLFDHANAGGFRGAFTDGANLVILRSALREVAQKIMAGGVTDVLIADIVRQDN
ncbi:MAG: flagellar basal body-associated FliL family protein [Gemmobacter sp.]